MEINIEIGSFKYGSLPADDEFVNNYETTVINDVITAIPPNLTVKQVANLISRIGYELEKLPYNR